VAGAGGAPAGFWMVIGRNEHAHTWDRPVCGGLSFGASPSGRLPQLSHISWRNDCIHTLRQRMTILRGNMLDAACRLKGSISQVHAAGMWVEQSWSRPGSSPAAFWKRLQVT
jgi:hypothetical protein